MSGNLKSGILNSSMPSLLRCWEIKCHCNTWQWLVSPLQKPQNSLVSRPSVYTCPAMHKSDVLTPFPICGPISRSGALWMSRHSGAFNVFCSSITILECQTCSSLWDVQLIKSIQPTVYGQFRCENSFACGQQMIFQKLLSPLTPKPHNRMCEKDPLAPSSPLKLQYRF